MVGRKLLVAGNDANLLQEITAEFRSRGCWVNTAANAAQGIQRLFQDHPHMVIIDTGDEASDWGGWKLCRNIIVYARNLHKIRAWSRKLLSETCQVCTSPNFDMRPVVTRNRNYEL